jgi:hypothetical protein
VEVADETPWLPFWIALRTAIQAFALLAAVWVHIQANLGREGIQQADGRS